jgi:uncharacterized hydrophobic protein (TIGR00271 family)
MAADPESRDLMTTPGEPPGGGTLARWGQLLHGGSTDTHALDELSGKLYFEGGPTADASLAFGVLLFLSAVIATGGVLADSTATVIGAMIIAPLMTPIMATALSIVTGDERHLARSVMTVIIAVGFVVALSFGIALLAPRAADLRANAEVAGRISPRVVDLLIALASGAAGAFALGRRSVSDALPGVAIAISLVPPLCVVGISLEAGDVGAASGASLLFLTNMLAILVAGGGTFALMGYSAAARQRIEPRGRRRALLATALATLVVTVPLFVTSLQLGRDSQLELLARQAGSEWLAGSGYEILQVEVSGDSVTLTLDGDGQMPPTARLVEAIGRQRPGVALHLRILAARNVRLPTP